MLSSRTCPLALSLALVCLGAAPAAATDTWSTPFAGIKRLHRTTSNQNINALVIDLCAPGISLRATASGERKRTVSAFGRLVGAQAAINGDFFSYQDYSTNGLSMSGGVAWPGTADHGYVAPLAIGPRQIELPHHSHTTAVAPWMKEIVSGHPTLLDDGVVVGNPGDGLCTNRHPRTIAGISQDHRTLILAVVDGRAPGRAGMTCPELAALLKELGAFDGVNLDGGGSSTMVVGGRVVNSPSDGSERVVANHLAVYAKGSGTAEHCPGPPPAPVLTINAEILPPAGQPADRCSVGASKDIFDWTVGDELEAHVDVKNTGDAIAKNAELGLWAEEPYLKIKRWEILSDWQQPAGSFAINDVDGMQKIPRDDPGQSFKLWLASISPGESKRIKLLVRAEQGSLADPVDHPDLRAWVSHVDNWYEKADFDAAPNNVDSRQKHNGGDLRAFVQTDVLAPESCDGKDNDCNGQIDEGLSGCDTTPVVTPDAGAAADDAGSDARRSGGGKPVTPTDRPPVEGGGCAVAAPPACGPLALLLALGLLRRRTRCGR